MSSELSPVVEGIKWELSAQHPEWDVCDYLSKQDLYGLGAGVYPPELLPPKPHPNCLCYSVDTLRDVEAWDDPRDVPGLQEQPSDVPLGRRANGFTENYIKRQHDLFVQSVEATEAAYYGRAPVPADEFIPASTVAEAEKTAIEAGVAFADYSGLSIEYSNLINKALAVVPLSAVPDFIGSSSKYKNLTGRAIGRKVKSFYGAHVGLVGATLPSQMVGRPGAERFQTIETAAGNLHTMDKVEAVFISSGYKTPGKVTERKNAVNSQYVAKSGKEWFFNATGETVPLHEMGHVFFDRNRVGSPSTGWGALAKRWADESSMGSIAAPSEAFAEAFADYFYTGGQRLPGYIKSFIDKMAK